MKHSLKFFTLLILLVLNCFFLEAQKHFIYIQSEDKQPFAIVLNGKVYSSSDYGYVILPKLADGKYDFTVSFPMNKFPDQTFSCSVNKKDEGYTLKNGSDGWALENLLTQKTLANTTGETEKRNAFGNMLSDVVNDSTLTKKTLAPADTVATSNTAITNSIADSVLQPQKISESKLDTGTNMLFVDKTQTGMDTVNVFIPNETTATDTITTTDKLLSTDTVTVNNNASQEVDSSDLNKASENNNIKQPAENTVTTNNATSIDTSNHDASNPFYKPDANITTENTNITSVNQTTSLNANNAVKQDCENTISDDELNKLKRKMFTHSSDNDMIQYAVKYLNKKCITTEQVKELGRLFSSDNGRYDLYDALYAHTYDYGNYASLASQIIDPYYKKRFAALLR